MNININDPYYCNTEVKILSKLVLVSDDHLDELENENIRYRVIRHLSVAGLGCKVYYNIAVNDTKLSETVELINKVNSMENQPIEAYFELS